MTTPPVLSPVPQSFGPHRCWYAALFRLSGCAADPTGDGGQSIGDPHLTAGPPPVPTPVPTLAASSETGGNALIELAQNFSPRYECHRRDLVVVDVSGLDRLFGDPHRLGEELRRAAHARRLSLQIAIAATRTAALILAVARPGVTVIGRGEEGIALAPIDIGILENVYDVGTASVPSAQRPPGHTRAAADAINVVDVCKRWGLKTLGQLAALPASALAARLGQRGLVWHSLACGQDVGPLVPTLANERFESAVELEWPIEGLEPLSFVLTRLLEPLSTRLERRDRGAAVVHVTLGLVRAHDIQCEAHPEPLAHVPDAVDPASVNGTTSSGAAPDTYTRSLQLPAPIRDVRTLRTLILLDLESHPPASAIERVAIVIDPTPGRVLQHALFVRAHPTPEQLSTLMARLAALMGDDRVGRPAVVDSYRPGAFAMQPFPVDDEQRSERRTERTERTEGTEPTERTERIDNCASQGTDPASTVASALRRCRRPVPARVSVADGRPTAVTTERRGFAGGRVLDCAGPWRSSGEWWALGSDTPRRPEAADSIRQACWNRDEWDVALSDGALYRIFQDRVTERWFIDAIVD